MSRSLLPAAVVVALLLTGCATAPTYCDAQGCRWRPILVTAAHTNPPCAVDVIFLRDEMDAVRGSTLYHWESGVERVSRPRSRRLAVPCGIARTARPGARAFFNRRTGEFYPHWPWEDSE